MIVQLSPDQLKRLRSALIAAGVARSPSHARKITSTPSDCRSRAVSLFSVDGVPDSLMDISELYSVPEKPISIPLPVPEKKRVRGKGLKPAKVMHRLRLDQVQLDALSELGGNISNHIRLAIDQYLKCKGGGTTIE